MSAPILIVDDEPNITLSFSSLLKDEGYQTITAASAEEATAKIAGQTFGLVLLDLQLPGQSGLELLKQLKRDVFPPPVLVISGHADIPTALEAIRLGAVDFLEKPVPPEKLVASVRACMDLGAALKQRTLMVEEMDDRCRIVGQSAAIRKMLAAVAHVAPTDTTVLITGENGTGKELIASRLYLESQRRERPFVRINCPGIPETLFESELFGYTKGSFTGAVKDHPGKFGLADGGTIFLDEIGDLPLSCQAKLLRVLETGEVETLGSQRCRTVDVRVICATNRDLEKLVSEQKFRQDLYYRISVFVIDAPPLSARLDDVPLLVGEFLRRFNPSQSTSISPAALAYLSAQPYPGNVRQLKNLIERLCILYKNRIIEMDDIAGEFGSPNRTDLSPGGTLTLSDQLALIEKRIIERTLKECDGNISHAAQTLQIDRANLSRKVKDMGLKDL